MKIENYQFPKSSFLSVEKDLNIIISKMMKNDRLLKLLYYDTPDALHKPNLSEKQKGELINRNIRIVPNIDIDSEIQSYISICFDSFVGNGTNPEFRDNTIIFDIYCNFDNWHLEDFQLRPYKIAAEIDSMFDKQHLTGIGDLEFNSAHFMSVNNSHGGIMLIYLAIHGGEDKIKMPNPIDEEQFIQDFNRMYNQE